MEQNTQRSLFTRVRSIPRPLGLALLGVPVLASAGVFGLPALASASPPGDDTVLVVAAHPNPTTTRHPDRAEHPAQAGPGHGGSGHSSRQPGTGMTKEWAAFFDAGYDYDDAVLLARVWGQGVSPEEAKTRAGDKLRHRSSLPVGPGESPWSVSDEIALEAYFANGYDYTDAQKLAALWDSPDLGDAKIMAGHKLLAGLDLPLS